MNGGLNALSEYQIPFNKPYLSGKEFHYIKAAVQDTHISGDGKYTKLCCDFLMQESHVAKAFLTTSCTHALEMSSILLNLKELDEVIVPSFTFVSTANAYLLRRAKLVFADIRKDTLTIDESCLENLITPRTKAIIPVHYAGVGCQMDSIIEIANQYHVSVVEDNSHGFLGKYKGKMLGTFGCMSTLSFHETKNFICGEGGALLVNDPSYIERAEIIREKGTNRSQLFRGEADKYTWIDIGSSYLPSDILAAFLYAQFEQKEEIQDRRKQLWNCYYNGLENWAFDHGVQLPIIPDYCEQPYHMFYMVMPRPDDRNHLIEYLKINGIQAVFHYLPLHLSTMGARFGYKAGDLPVTENISECLIRLPFYNTLSANEQDYIIEKIVNFYT